MVYAPPAWWYNAYRPQVFAKSEVCTLNVIDGCAHRFSDDPHAQSACREGARDSYLLSTMGRDRALQSGQMDAYATGYHATATLCGEPYHPAYGPLVSSVQWW